MVSPEGETPAFNLASFTSVCFDIPEVMNMSKHMTIQDRQDISAGLKAGDSFGSIARKIGKSATTVSREIRSHRIVWDKKPYGRSMNRCANRHGCRLRGVCNSHCDRLCPACGACTKKCSMYVEERCEKLQHPPYVCTACPNLHRCSLEKFCYDPYYAQQEYMTTLRESREGFNLTQAELAIIDAQISSLILQGQSVHHAVLARNNSLPVSRRTIYRLVDKCALKARNIDLPRKSKLKPRKTTKPQRKIDKDCRVGRTFQEYNTYIAQHNDIMPVQMDTVLGGNGTSKVLLTIRFQGDFMPVFLRDNNTAQTVHDWIEFLYENLGHDDFCAFFPVILTDNGSEFSNPSAIETAPDGSARTKIFYCDPGATWQKPNVERCHEMFRRVLPSGCSFDDYTQSDMALVASHVNSYARPALSDKTPMDALAFFYGERRAEKLLRLLGHTRIQPDKVVLTPALLKR